MSYDPKCQDLAEYFCEDSVAVDFEVRQLAQVIQDAVEDWLRDLEEEADKKAELHNARSPQQQYRKSQFDELISENDCAFESGAEYPGIFDRYLVIEKTSGEVAWFYLADSLEECAKLIDISDTECEVTHIFDLDSDGSNHLIIPVVQVTAFLVSGQGRVERKAEVA
jgi:hypothetical protein